MRYRKERKKLFFSEEKNQKTFVLAPISAGASPAGTHGDITGGQKFLVLFFKKEQLPYLLFDGPVSTRVGIRALRSLHSWCCARNSMKRSATGAMLRRNIFSGFLSPPPMEVMGVTMDATKFAKCHFPSSCPLQPLLDESSEKKSVQSLTVS